MGEIPRDPMGFIGDPKYTDPVPDDLGMGGGSQGWVVLVHLSNLVKPILILAQKVIAAVVDWELIV